MGGHGSGRTGWKPKAEHFRSLDVNKMYRSRALELGRTGGWKWSIDGEQDARIRYRAEDRGVRLIYRCQS